MEVIKAKTADIICAGDIFEKGCGSTLRVSAADLKKTRVWIQDDDYVTVSCIICPLCGSKTRVKNNLTPYHRSR